MPHKTFVASIPCKISNHYKADLSTGSSWPRKNRQSKVRKCSAKTRTSSMTSSNGMVVALTVLKCWLDKVLSSPEDNKLIQQNSSRKEASKEEIWQSLPLSVLTTRIHKKTSRLWKKRALALMGSALKLLEQQITVPHSRPLQATWFNSLLSIRPSKITEHLRWSTIAPKVRQQRRRMIKYRRKSDTTSSLAQTSISGRCSPILTISSSALIITFRSSTHTLTSTISRNGPPTYLSANPQPWQSSAESVTRLIYSPKRIALRSPWTSTILSCAYHC